ncbi:MULTISPECIES: phosphodiester glycosidase family protein [Acinetobacter]|uniref:Phosphodiester glycosidase family protein n=1 Tax=Acinetobacter entericus TaxID=2989714 RepID=A0ABT3NET7_9GAMM|nr:MULTISPECIES: phosphodiester glycosidase family protein [Acinetobacter]MCW8038074.1 phosphodiester glycosidase family protein [Acinetobacter entericus]TCB76263.1 hypothetical protein E0H91_03105 [Acinetobacter sp. ANC 4177]
MKLLNTWNLPVKAGFLALSLFAVQQAPAKPRSWESEKPIQSAVVEVRDFKNLGLYLYSPQNAPYLTFSRLDAALRKRCRILQFAMNAGMYHADFSPVGLYIENGQQLRGLNKAKHGFGNFFIQPNGVLAWNDQKALIQTTDAFQRNHFKARYATQSGPMLVINGRINANFLQDASSYKIRNGVGIKDQKLYFVISREPVTFYQFASYFKDSLKTDNALYLDGSISSIYSSSLNLHDASPDLGPMLAYSEPSACK